MLRDQRFKGYSVHSFQKDVVSGVIVGIVALPLAMAFAIASGVRPEYGLYTTIIAGFFIALCGGSRFQIGGPTGAFVPILLGIVMQYGYENLLIAGFMAGIMLILMGVLKIGNLIHYIPRPVTIGFTAGIAVLIFLGQVPSFLGLHNLKPEEEFIYKMRELFMNLNDIHLYSVITGLTCFFGIWLTSRFVPRVPAALIGLLLSTFVAVFFYPQKVATIGSVFGAISNQLPQMHFPDITFAKIVQLFIPALIVAMLGGIESLLSAIVADGMSGDRHRSNRELVGQGIANMITSLFGGIPATGAIARTATNIRNGAVSPVSGMIHSIFVLVVLIAFSSYAASIPLASMAPILMVVAWNMSERKEFMYVLKAKTEDSIVLVATFALTVLFDLVVGVGVGLALAFFLFGIRMSKNFIIRTSSFRGKASPPSTGMAEEVHVCALDGPIFFGSAQQITRIRDSCEHKKVLVLCMSKVPYIDVTGEHILEDLLCTLQTADRVVIMRDIQEQPLSILEKICTLQHMGQGVFFIGHKGADHASEAVRVDVSRVLQHIP